MSNRAPGGARVHEQTQWNVFRSDASQSQPIRQIGFAYAGAQEGITVVITNPRVMHLELRPTGSSQDSETMRIDKS